MTKLKHRLKDLIIEALNLEDVAPEDLADDEALMDSGLGLDSIDALELVVRVEKEFSIKIKNSEEAREALGSINTLATFIQSRQGEVA
ncbi:phosphopantetheine-binding protein [Cerasicoccus arenae]|uniref:Acyl carrier protein n=1 Tax=Cerasicoccus arenae TaxID=424488 RepID=A0A8J3GCT0_9BACT|nr:phosphopantetheine-binding protein [Cerasicoccus arenae]MBK1858316.1 acyl carrier protein [Cerasicoccus arenae]GHB90727.1 acyl carrier protein [Cerasicoccus arenae]